MCAAGFTGIFHAREMYPDKRGREAPDRPRGQKRGTENNNAIIPSSMCKTERSFADEIGRKSVGRRARGFNVAEINESFRAPTRRRRRFERERERESRDDDCDQETRVSPMGEASDGEER